MENIQLSKNFFLNQCTNSQIALRYKIDNTPSQEVINNLKLVCENVLEPIYSLYGNIVITSGYRCLELNRKIGSKDNSQHINGCAVDFIIPTMKIIDLYNSIRLNNAILFDQLINEFNSWVHVSFVKNKNRRSYFELK